MTDEDRKYTLTYKITVVPEGATKEELEANDTGGADALLLVSVAYPKDGSFSVFFISKDGRTDAEMTDAEVFKIWTLLTHRLGESLTLTPGKKDLCRRVFEHIRAALLGG